MGQADEAHGSDIRLKEMVLALFREMQDTEDLRGNKMPVGCRGHIHEKSNLEKACGDLARDKRGKSCLDKGVFTSSMRVRVAIQEHAKAYGA